MQYTTGTIQSAQKVVIYGPEGIGKSSFAAKFPAPIFADVEGSTKKLDVKRTPKPTSWTMLLEQVRYFISHPSELRTFVIDTADWAEILCTTHICSASQKKGIEDFGYGKGYTYLAEEFGRLLNLLEELVERGVHVVVTAHAQMRKFEQPDEMGAYDRWEMKLQKKTAPMLREWADMVLFANYKTYVINVDDQGSKNGKNKAQGGHRVMYTTHHPCWDAKNRDGLPDELELDYAKIAHCIMDIPVDTLPVSSPPQAIKEPEPTPPPAPDPVTAPAPPPPEPVASTPPPGDIGANIPRALHDLMQENMVLEAEIQMAVADKGYYPIGTPIENYDPAFVNGVLIGAWPQVFEMITDLRAKNAIPF